MELKEAQLLRNSHIDSIQRMNFFLSGGEKEIGNRNERFHIQVFPKAKARAMKTISDLKEQLKELDKFIEEKEIDEQIQELMKRKAS